VLFEHILFGKPVTLCARNVCLKNQDGRPVVLHQDRTMMEPVFILVGLCDLILGEVRLGHGSVTLVWLGDLILGEVRLGHGEVTLVGLGDFILGEIRIGHE